MSRYNKSIPNDIINQYPNHQPSNHQPPNHLPHNPPPPNHLSSHFHPHHHLPSTSIPNTQPLNPPPNHQDPHKNHQNPNKNYQNPHPNHHNFIPILQNPQETTHSHHNHQHTTHSHPNPQQITHSHPYPKQTTHSHPNPQQTTHSYHNPQQTTHSYHNPQQTTHSHHNPQQTTHSHHNPQQTTHSHHKMSHRAPAELPTKPRSFSSHKKPVLRLRPLSDCNEQCSLLQRRTSTRKSQNNSLLQLQQPPHESKSGSPPSHLPTRAPHEAHLTGVLFNQLKTRDEVCGHCGENFMEDEKMFNLHGLVWHERCFVCAQCFQAFPEGIFFEFEGRRYCQIDFDLLFAPRCHHCKEFIRGRVIKAVGANWHAACFRCQLCDQTLADVGFVRNNKRSLCKECHEKEKVRLLGKNVCSKCRCVVEENDYVKFKGDVFHAFHFNCKTCGIELNSIAREKDKELYCLRCYDKLGIPICAACRRPVEEKTVHALGKSWHIEHFVCSVCDKAFFGNKHYEDKGLAYCELHYYQMRGGTCFYCNNVITGNELTALNKSFCEHHFSCWACNKVMSNKSKFLELDAKPVCKSCYNKFPSEFVKRLKKMAAGKDGDRKK